MHQFKFTQEQAKHLSVEEFEHYAELRLIRGVGPHMQEVLTRRGEMELSLQEELQDAEDKIETFPAECPECGATLAT